MWINLLLLFVPISLVLGYVLEVSAIWVFVTAIVAIVPLAEWIRRGTEQMAEIAGPGDRWFAQRNLWQCLRNDPSALCPDCGSSASGKGTDHGRHYRQWAVGVGAGDCGRQIWRRRQRFNREHAGLLSSLLILAVIALMVPALFNYTERGIFALPAVNSLDEDLSLGVAVVLILIYGANLGLYAYHPS